MSNLQIKKVDDGLWDIDGRGKLELTPQGVFYFGVIKESEKWAEDELKQITDYIAHLRRARDHD